MRSVLWLIWLLSLGLGTSTASSQERLWEFTLDERDANSIGEVVVAGDYLYVVGNSQSFDPPSEVQSTLRIDLGGNLDWRQDVEDVGFGSLTVSSNGAVYVAGSTETLDAVVVIKRLPSGSELWRRRFEPTTDGRVSVREVEAVGPSVYVLLESATQEETWTVLLKYDDRGNQLWCRRLGGSDDERVSPVDFEIADSSGNTIVIGRRFRFDGTEQVGNRFVVVRFNAMGDAIWTREYPGVDEVGAAPNDAVVTSDGEVRVVGLSQRQGECEDSVCGSITTVQYSPSGRLEWSQSVSSPAAEGFVGRPSAVQDDNGNVLVLGGAPGPSGDSDVTLAKYSGEGDELWVTQWDSGAGLTDRIAGLPRIDSRGNIYVLASSIEGEFPDIATRVFVVGFRGRTGHRFLDFAVGEEGSILPFQLHMDRNDDLYLTFVRLFEEPRPVTLAKIRTLPPASFVQSEANGDGALDVSDAVFILGFLFLGNSEPSCLAALDANGDGDIDLSDAVMILGNLFLGSPPVLPGMGECQALPEDDALSCEQSPCSEES